MIIRLALLASGTAVALCAAVVPFAQDPPAASPITASPPGVPVLSLSMVFTAFVVMLGPMQLVARFAKLTGGMRQEESRRIALKAFGFACLGGVIAASIGQYVLGAW